MGLHNFGSSGQSMLGVKHTKIYHKELYPTMPFGAHETMEVHEILNEKMNLISHFSMYAQQAQDIRLRQMVERHLQTAVQSYDQLVSYTHDYNAAAGMRPPYGMPNVQPQQIQYGLHNPSQHMPQMQGRMNDHQILSAVLSCHKNSARNHMHASLECADPNVRQMLLSGAINCANQAYEVFLYMNHQGSYQVPTMNDHTAKTFLHAYQPMNESMAMGEYGQTGGMNRTGPGMSGMSSVMATSMNNMTGAHMGGGMNASHSDTANTNAAGSNMYSMAGMSNTDGSNIQQ